MAHECPDCGLICHCHGDIDDILMDTDDNYVKCTHYLECQQDEDEDDEEPEDKPIETKETEKDFRKLIANSQTDPDYIAEQQSLVEDKPSGEKEK
jgi:hypothetical protein